MVHHQELEVAIKVQAGGKTRTRNTLEVGGSKMRTMPTEEEKSAQLEPVPTEPNSQLTTEGHDEARHRSMEET